MALRSGGTLYWLLSDHLGSTAVTLSGTTEAGEVRYRAFGASRFTSGLALAADVGGLLLPGLTGGGLLVRAATHADDVAAGALHAAAHADDAADAARAAAQGGEAAGAVGRTVARDGDPTDEVRDAYAIATRGGKHAGLLQTYAGRSEKEIRKAIRSFERVADLHRRKLANPEQYAEQWEHMSPERRERLLVYWRREVAVYTEQADVLRGLLDHMQH